jgi:hypothetical protein
MLIATYCGWALNHVIHDRADWLQEWAAQLDAAPSPPLWNLLGYIYRLDPACWPTFLGLLTTAGPRSRAALLESVSWLLRKNQIPAEHSQDLADVLLKLARTPETATAQSALFALGCFRQPPPAVVDALLAAAQDQPAALPALARLAPHLAAGDQERVDRSLAAAAALPEADAALVRRLVNRQPEPSSSKERDQFDPAALLEALAQRQPDPERQLRALLAAGTDDDVWDDFYHGRIALAIRELLAQHEEVWSLLLDDLRAALDDGDWQRHRIALAGLARSAEAMPARFNRSATDLEPLLLRATARPEQFQCPALCHHRALLPAGDHARSADGAAAAGRRHARGARRRPGGGGALQPAASFPEPGAAISTRRRPDRSQRATGASGRPPARGAGYVTGGLIRARPAPADRRGAGRRAASPQQPPVCVGLGENIRRHTRPGPLAGAAAGGGVLIPTLLVQAVYQRRRYPQSPRLRGKGVSRRHHRRTDRAPRCCAPSSSQRCQALVWIRHHPARDANTDQTTLGFVAYDRPGVVVRRCASVRVLHAGSAPVQPPSFVGGESRRVVRPR